MRAQSRGIDPDDAERSAGFLTTTEREYLLDEWNPNEDEDGYTESQADRKKSDIGIRTRHALADFALLQQRADEEMKESVILTEAEPPVFPEDMFDQLVQGLLRFASDAAINEEFSEYLFDAVESGEFDELDEESKTALQYAAGGNKKMYLRSHFNEWCENAAELGIEKREVLEAVGRAWPDE